MAKTHVREFLTKFVKPLVAGGELHVGAPIPLYLAGAEVVSMYPFGPLMEGTGLNITVVSSDGDMNIGLIVCPDLVDDPAEMVDGIVDGVATLAAAARRHS